MLEETATVIAVEKDSLWVESQSRSSCSSCSSSHCSSSAISQLFSLQHNRLRLNNSLDAQVGDQVVIGIPDELLVRASMWGYLLPLLAMVGFAVIGNAWHVSEGLQVLLAMLGLAVGLYVVRLVTRHSHAEHGNEEQAFQAQLLRIATHGGLHKIQQDISTQSVGTRKHKE